MQRRLKQIEISIISKLLTSFIFYLLCSSFFFSGFTFVKEASCFIIFILSLCSNMLNLENILEYIHQKLKKHAHFKVSSQDEVFTRLFFFFSSWDEISSRQKRVNSKRHFTIDRDDFIPGRVSSWDEISGVNTLSKRKDFPSVSNIL